MFKIAWRNLWRNRRRTSLTMAAVAFSVFFLNFMMSLQEGSYGMMLKSSTKTWNGKLRIFRKSYFGRESLSKSFVMDDNLRRKLDSLNLNWTERIDGFALVSFENRTYGASITGLDPMREIKTTSIHTKLIEGRFLNEGEKNSTLLGDKLAENLNLRLEDEIAVVAQGKDGSIGAKLLKVKGIFRTGMVELDRSKMITVLEDADELFSMDGTVTSAVLYFERGQKEINRIKETINEWLGGTDLEVLDWKEIMPEALELIEFDRISGYLMYAVLVIIIAFGLLNTVHMAVYDRKKEIAVLRAIGMKRVKLARMIISETVFLSAIGAVAGFILSYPVILYFKSHPIRLSGKVAEVMESFMFIPELHVALSFKVMFFLSVCVLIVAVVMTVFPSMRAVRENLAGQLKFEK
ncbi:MAG: FtsX-like permease family protein [Candidatus Aminicenantales bacterium]